MATDKLQIELDAAWRGKSSVQKANNALKRLAANAGKVNIDFKKMAIGATVAFAAVGAAAVIAWKTIGEGAALLQARDQFERLTVSIDSTADAMLGKLRAATNGMISDAELIAGAGQIISLGLADTEDSVIRLSTLVGKLGWDMQQVILTFANNSVMRLDSLGLSVEDVNSKMKDLEAQGYSTDKAFDMAVILAGEEKLALLGDTADTTAGKLQMIITVGENAKSAFAESFATELAGQLDDASESAGELEESIVTLADTVGFSFAGIVSNVLNAAIAILQVEIAVAKVTAALSRLTMRGPGAGALDTSNQMVIRGMESRLAGLMGEDFGITANQQLGLATGTALPTADDILMSQIGNLGYTLSTTADSMKYASGAAVTLEQEMGLIAGASDEAKDAMAAAADTTDDLVHGIGGVGVAAESAAEKMARLAAETGKFFDQARRSDEFDPAEAFYSAALAAGASAAQLQQLLVGTGLETPERAQEIYNESIQRQLAQQAGQAFAGGDNFDMLWQGIQAGMANPQWAEQVTQNIASTTNVGGVSVSVTINGNITGEDLDMVVDNAVSEAVSQMGGP